MVHILVSEERVLAILGGSLDQLATIKEAKNLGLKALVIDMDEDCPGFKIADYKLPVSTRNTESILHKLQDFQNRHRKLAGFFVQGTDIPQVGAFLSKHFNIQSINQDLAQMSVHKFQMKNFLKANKFPIPTFMLIENFSDFQNAPTQLGFPFVLKPVDRSGARGVLKINNASQVDSEHFQLALNESISKQMIAEQYIPGKQFSTESLIVNGVAHTLIIAERNYEFLEKYAPYILENGGWSDNLLSVDEQSEVKDLIQMVVNKLAIHRGIIKGDLVLSEDGTAIIEFALRASGGDLSESLIPLGTGLNYLSLAIRNTIGDEILQSELVPRITLSVANRYFFPSNGIIRFKKNNTLLPDYVKKFEFWVPDNSICRWPKSHADRIGVFVVTGESRNEVNKRCDSFYCLNEPEYL